MQPYYVFCDNLTSKYLQYFLEGVYDTVCWSLIGHRSTQSDSNGFSIYSLKILLKIISTEHSQQLKAFKLKYLGPVEVIFL